MAMLHLFDIVKGRISCPYYYFDVVKYMDLSFFTTQIM